MARSLQMEYSSHHFDHPETSLFQTKRQGFLMNLETIRLRVTTKPRDTLFPMLTDRDPALPFCRTIAVNGHYLQDREPPAHMETDDACSHVVYLAGSPVIRATQRWTTGCHNSLERRASCCSGERSGVGTDSPTGNHGRQSDRRRDSARDDVRASCREAHTAEPERKPTP